MKVKRLSPVDGAMLACDECGRLLPRSALTEIKLDQNGNYLYVCGKCKQKLAAVLRGERNAG